MAKEAKKEEKRRQKEAEHASREARQTLSDQREEALRLKREEEEAEEEAEREAELEKKRAEEEEYNKWKGEIKIEAEGTSVLSESEELDLQRRFISFVKRKKVVYIEDIGAEFDMKSQEALSRVREYEARGDLTGALDERGKFIHLTRVEIEQLVQYINQKGRLSKSEDIVKGVNRIVRVTPSPEDLRLLEEEDEAALRAFEESVGTERGSADGETGLRGSH